MSTYSDDELLMLSGIQHFAFCRRQWALIHIEQQWLENLLTFGGRELHERADDPFFTEARGQMLICRSLPIVSYRLGLYGVADVVEFYHDENGITIKGRSGKWRPHPVEYKFGQPKPDDWDEVQLCAQGFCLEEMFNITIPGGDLFYGRIRRRQRVEFNESLRERVIQLAQEMHDFFRRGYTPPPNYTTSCKRCSLIEICLPHLSSKRSVSHYLTRALRDPE